MFGLHFAEGLDSTIQIVLTWVTYTLLWATFINVFVLGYFWSVVRNKSGPTGIRGPAGETGIIGLEGTCDISAPQSICIDALTKYIDALYFAKTQTHILNDETKRFPCNYLNNKISQMSGSKQYIVIIENVAVANIINYLKSIWVVWFELIYDATEQPGVWFNDEYADENYEWHNSANPFDEIKKYDIYYWGITRDFRPLKAEICRASNNYDIVKSPLHDMPKQPRLKIIQTNDYYRVGDNQSVDRNEDIAWWSPNKLTFSADTYYPVGDVITPGAQNCNKSGKTKSGNIEYIRNGVDNGPDMKTILVSGDVVSPIKYNQTADTASNDNLLIYEAKCPDGYTSIGDVSTSRYNNFNTYKCVPTDCVEKVKKASQGSEAWIKYHRWYNNNIFSSDYGWNYVKDFATNVLNTNWKASKEATGDNGYNLFRVNNSKDSFYKIKDSCLVIDPTDKPVKDVEPQFAEIGIGWNGHPYKLEPKYSIFTFLDLVPEGIIVNKGNGRRYYIIHYGGETANNYIILEYNKNTQKHNNALQISSKPNDSKVDLHTLNKSETRQQWSIILQSDKKQLKLKSIANDKYLYIGLEPSIGVSQFSTIDLDNNNYKSSLAFRDLSNDEITNGTQFTFISSFGTQMNILDK